MPADRQPDNHTLARAAAQLRALSAELDDLAWTLSVRDLGRALASLAQHLREDAQSTDLLALMVPAMEALPPEKKSEVNNRMYREQAQGTRE